MLLVVMKIWHWKSFVQAKRLLDANADLSHEIYKRFIQSIAFPYLVFFPLLDFPSPFFFPLLECSTIVILLNITAECR